MSGLALVFGEKSTGMTRKKRCHARNRSVIILSPNKNHDLPMSPILPIQEPLRPALPTVLGCKDYHQEQQLLERVDRILVGSGIEGLFLRLSVEQFEARATQARERGEDAQVGAKALERYLRQSRQALRCTVLKHLTGESYRGLSAGLARAPLYRWFCGCADFEVVRVPGKSTLQDYAQWLPMESMEKILAALIVALADEERAREIGLENELDLSVAWVDTTCLKADIHFPADWVLMRDGVRTVIKSIRVIRRHGLRKRMPEPTEFLREINALSMGMGAAARRKPGAKKERKKWLRAIKRVSKVVEKHGRSYRQALDERWAETDLTRKEAEVILRRLDRVLDQLPEARRQAHERIIGERAVPNGQKILSLYERDIHVVVRGKAGAEVEFGNSLFLAESADGLIVDHQLRREASPGDAKWLAERLPLLAQQCGGQLCGVVGDRGFDSKANVALLESRELFNGLCPKDPARMRHRMKEEAFAGALRRRAQTEGRVGILKNVFLGGKPLSKGFANRQLEVAWAVFSHNLWVVARRLWREEWGESAIAA